MYDFQPNPAALNLSSAPISASYHSTAEHRAEETPGTVDHWIKRARRRTANVRGLAGMDYQVISFYIDPVELTRHSLFSNVMVDILKGSDRRADLEGRGMLCTRLIESEVLDAMKDRVCHASTTSLSNLISTYVDKINTRHCTHPTAPLLPYVSLCIASGGHILHGLSIETMMHRRRCILAAFVRHIVHTVT